MRIELTPRCLAAAVLATLSCAFPSLAQPSTNPSTTQATTQAIAMTAVITGVEGIVQVRMDENSPWQKAAPGMQLTEGAEFRTGPRSAVRFEIPPNQTITLDRLGVVKLLEAIRAGANVKTDLGMQYGRVRYDVEAAGLSHNSTIHSPGSSLAVRGTRVSLYDQPPFIPQATSLTGRAAFRNARREMVGFGGKARASVKADDNASAQSAMTDSIIQDPQLEWTEQQIRETTFLAANGGFLLGNVATSTVPVTDAQLPSLLGGQLDFVLRWSHPRGEGADLNLFVRTPLNETMGNPPFVLSLFPGNQQIGDLLTQNDFPPTTPSGGSVGLNHIGPEGIEIGSFSRPPPKGLYIAGAYNFIFSEKPLDPKRSTAVAFQLEVFHNGVRQPLVLNLAAALAGTESPRCGLVFRESVAVGELKPTAVQILDPNDKSPRICPPNTTDNPTRTAKPRSKIQSGTGASPVQFKNQKTHQQPVRRPR